MAGNDDARLIAAARRGDTRAFAGLVDANQQSVRAFLRRYSGDGVDADDIAQEAFVTAWARLDRFDGRSSFRSWVIGIGYRLARDARRARTRAAARDSSWLECSVAVGADAPAEDLLTLANAMAELPEPQRAAVALCLGEGFSHAEAAAALKLPLGTVKSHVARGREQLLRTLGGDDE